MSGSSKLKALWHMQQGECFYCGGATWLHGGGESKAQARARLGVTGPRAELRQRQATKEHLHRISDGGSNDLGNLVMACADCNGRRGPMPSLLFLSLMRVLPLSPRPAPGEHE